MKDYIKQAIRTESRNFYLSDAKEDTRLLHAAIGLCTEAGEFLDSVKKQLFYGAPKDATNLKEELGDLCWYMAVAMDSLGTNFEKVMETNIAKLRARYPEKFTSENALNRDLDAERKTLSQGE